MATVTKCDRCGTIYNPMTIIVEEQDCKFLGSDESWRLSITKELWPHAGEMKIDLCPNCKAELNDWLHMADECIREEIT